MDINVFIGILGLILAVIGIIYSNKTYKKDHIDKPQEEKLHLLAQFRATQTLSNNVYRDLYNYVEKHNAFEEFMWPDITYNTYLESIRNSQKENLSDELYEKVLNMQDIPSMTIASMCKSLETQFDALNLMQTEINLRLKTIPPS